MTANVGSTGVQNLAVSFERDLVATKKELETKKGRFEVLTNKVQNQNYGFKNALTIAGTVAIVALTVLACVYVSPAMLATAAAAKGSADAAGFLVVSALALPAGGIWAAWQNFSRLESKDKDQKEMAELNKQAATTKAEFATRVTALETKLDLLRAATVDHYSDEAWDAFKRLNTGYNNPTWENFMSKKNKETIFERHKADLILERVQLESLLGEAKAKIEEIANF